MPVIPQVYYIGFLAGENDMALLAKSGIGRDINRRHYSAGEITAQLQRPVVQKLLALIRLRNEHPAFGGRIEVLDTAEQSLAMQWVQGGDIARLTIDFRTLDYRLSYNTARAEQSLDLGS